jgi:hypothetical protein
MPIPQPGLIANGTIYPSTFIMLNPALVAPAGFQAIQCTANGRMIGIAFEGTEQPPLPSSTYPLPAATSGNSIPWYANGQSPVLLKIGTTAVVAGQRLISDANGYGTPMATTGYPQNVGATALESAPAGALCRVQVDIFASIPTVT